MYFGDKIFLKRGGSVVYLEFARYLLWAINRPYGRSAGSSVCSNHFTVIILIDRHSLMKSVNNPVETSYFIHIFSIRDEIIVILLFTFSCQSGDVYSGKMHVLEIISCLMTSLQSSEVTNMII